MCQTNRKVLLVEDDPDTREQLSNLLQLWGYVVHAANDGIEALEVVRRHPPPCLVLLDLFLPKMSGWEVVAEFQKSQQLSAIPLIVVSGCGEDRLLPPADAHFSKPLDLRRFHSVLTSLC